MLQRITTRLTAILCIAGVGSFTLNAQDQGYSKTYFFNERSTKFHAIRQLYDKIIVYGQLGKDSFGNNGVFIAHIDTFGVINDLVILQDPSNEFNLDLGDGFSSSESITVKDGLIYFSGEIRLGLDLFIGCINENLDLVFFQQYNSNNIYSRYAQNNIVFKDAIYTVGFVPINDLYYDVFIHKADLEGNQIWEKYYGKEGLHDFATSMLIENEGITVLSTATKDPNGSIPNNDIIYNNMFHIDTSGEVIWSWEGEFREEGGYPASLQKVNSNYYYITIPRDEEQGILFSKPQLVCRDSSLELLWRKEYGDFLDKNRFTSLSIGPDSFLYAAGYIPDEVTWGRVCKINPQDGKLIWDARDTAFVIPGWGSRNRMEGLTVLESGSVIAVGYTMDYTYHENGLLYKVSSDGCIDTLCTTVAIDDLINNPDSRVHIYPNPASTDIFIDATISLQSSKLNIYDINGILVEQLALTEGRNRISILADQYKSGLYFGHVLSKNGRILDAGKIYVQVK